mmetsp:Transcript_35549/g.102204  ORF Transcript_35549/g.102204 Transcript_35549/m.102204 type:complete len:183 (-) Transcript_35549:721-1269(-)
MGGDGANIGSTSMFGGMGSNAFGIKVVGATSCCPATLGGSRFIGTMGGNKSIDAAVGCVSGGTSMFAENICGANMSVTMLGVTVIADISMNGTGGKATAGSVGIADGADAELCARCPVTTAASVGRGTAMGSADDSAVLVEAPATRHGALANAAATSPQADAGAAGVPSKVAAAGESARAAS